MTTIDIDALSALISANVAEALAKALNPEAAAAPAKAPAKAAPAKPGAFAIPGLDEPAKPAATPHLPMATCLRNVVKAMAGYSNLATYATLRTPEVTFAKRLGGISTKDGGGYGGFMRVIESSSAWLHGKTVNALKKRATEASAKHDAAALAAIAKDLGERVWDQCPDEDRAEVVEAVVAKAKKWDGDKARALDAIVNG